MKRRQNQDSLRQARIRFCSIDMANREYRQVLPFTFAEYRDPFLEQSSSISTGKNMENTLNRGLASLRGCHIYHTDRHRSTRPSRRCPQIGRSLRGGSRSPRPRSGGRGRSANRISKTRPAGITPLSCSTTKTGSRMLPSLHTQCINQ